MTVKTKQREHRHKFVLCYERTREQGLTGDAGDEAEWPQHSEGSQGLHVKASALLHRHIGDLIEGIQNKGEETVGARIIQWR